MRLVIRADASSEIGMGHVVRCLALAEEWMAQGGQVDLASALLPDSLRPMLESAGLHLHTIVALPGSEADAAATQGLGEALEASWAVLDGYQFDAEYQDSLKRHGQPLLVLDDFGHASHYSADLVLNQNLYAHEGLYPRIGSETRLLLGLRYALLRRQFTCRRSPGRETPPTARNVLLTLGGGDTDRALAGLIEALAAARLPLAEAVAVVGPVNPEFHSIEQAALSAPWPVRLLHRVDDMASLMSWADLSISGGGSTCWELAFMGVPNCVLSMTEHQRLVAGALQQAGAAMDLSNLCEKFGAMGSAVAELARDPVRRAAMSARARELIDGRGASVVTRLLRAAMVCLRHATAEDSRLLWAWRNEPDVRAWSFQTKPIPWSDHARWFAKAVAEPTSSIWICTIRDGTPIGQGRVTVGTAEAEISVSLSPDWRGRGYGRLLIEALTERCFRDNPGTGRIVAYVKPSNAASLRAFEAAGFVRGVETTVAGQLAARMVRLRGAAGSEGA